MITRTNLSREILLEETYRETSVWYLYSDRRQTVAINHGQENYFSIIDTILTCVSLPSRESEKFWSKFGAEVTQHYHHRYCSEIHFSSSYSIPKISIHESYRIAEKHQAFFSQEARLHCYPRRLIDADGRRRPSHRTQEQFRRVAPGKFGRVASGALRKGGFTRRSLASGTVHHVGMPSRIGTRSTLAHCTWTRRRRGRGRLDAGLEYECRDPSKCMRRATLPCKQGLLSAVKLQPRSRPCSRE